MHLIRAGINNILFSDPDTMSEHNLSRHVLFDDSVFKNKACELKSVANMMYYHESSNTEASRKHIKSILEDADVMSKRKPDYLLDFSASKVVSNQLVNIEDRPTAISASIYDDGRFGLLLCEGNGDGARLDDVMTTFFAQYKTDAFVSNYLMREKGLSEEPFSISMMLHAAHKNRNASRKSPR